jgi:DNA/RNA-binding domain of Phe-tRNA-synthetase-like protein
MAQSVVTEVSSKKQRVASIVEVLQAEGEQLTHEDLDEIQTKTDALLKAKGDVHIHAGGTHIDVEAAKAA